MKKSVIFPFAVALTLGFMASCQNDDSDFSAYTLTGASTDDDDDDEAAVTDTIYIAFSGTRATVSGDSRGVVSATGADVTVSDSVSSRGLVLVLGGSATDGSLLVYRSKKYTIQLNGVSLTNQDGPAINNQCGKSLYVVCAEGTTSTLTDGPAYAERTYDQKGTLFSEGQIYFSGAGTLVVNANSKNGIASDDYITIDHPVTINVVTTQTGTNGVKANDGLFVNGGTLTVDVASDGGRGLRSEARTVIAGGTVTISTSGDCLIEEADGVRDTTSAACIKSDSLFTMSGGTLTMTSTGDGGKCIRCSENIEFSGGTLVAKTLGGNDVGKPKALKSDKGIIVSGGSFTATVLKSWACDNGSESDDPVDHLTVVGTPSSAQIQKRSVVIVY